MMMDGGISEEENQLNPIHYLSDEKRVEQIRKMSHQEVKQEEDVIKKHIKHLVLILFALVAILLIWVYSVNQNLISFIKSDSQKSHKLMISQIKLERVQERQKILIKLLNDPQIRVHKNLISAISPLAITSDKKSISQFIYTNEGERNRRNDFHRQREDFIDIENINEIKLAKYNMILDIASEIESIDQNQKEWIRLNQKYGLERQKQLSMCIVSPGFNNRDNFRIQYSLNSIFTQNYSNYKAVIIDDASNDGSGEIYKRYFEFYNLIQNKKKLNFIQNQIRVSNMANFYKAIYENCQQQEIIVGVDADDQLIGRNILQVLNAVYQSQQLGMIYSNFFWYQQNVKIQLGFTKQYTTQEIRKKLYRQSQIKFSHLRSFKRKLFMQINPIDFKDNFGNFYKIAADLAMYFPILELSCGKISRLNETQYLYNIATGLNDYAKGELQAITAKEIGDKTKYKCSPEYGSERV